MTAITADTPLASIVNEHPQLAGRLERLGLDYCCGGRTPLGDAAAERGLSVDELLADLTDAAEASGDGRADWADLSMAPLVDHIESTHHAYLHDEMPRLVALAQKVAGVHGGRHPELAEVERLTVELWQDFQPHLQKEELMLFPMIRELAAAVDAGSRPPASHASLAAPISVMLAEHDRTAEILEQIREVAGDYAVPADACGSYQALYAGLAAVEADTHLHVHKENNLLFPAVVGAEATTAT